MDEGWSPGRFVPRLHPLRDAARPARRPLARHRALAGGDREPGRHLLGVPATCGVTRRRSRNRTVSLSTDRRVESNLARDTVARGIYVGPVLVLVFGLLRGWEGAWSAALGVLVVVANFLLAGAILSISARISLQAYHAAALIGFFLRLGSVRRRGLPRRQPGRRRPDRLRDLGSGGVLRPADAGRRWRSSRDRERELRLGHDDPRRRVRCRQ